VALKLSLSVVLAVFGELHPKVVDGMDVKGPAVAAIIYLENVPFPKAKSKTRAALTSSDYQAVERDFAFVVDANIEAETILKAARGADKALIEAATVFDVFADDRAGSQMGEGRKSVAISVRLQPKSGTLTDQEIEAIAAKLIANVEKATGGTLRR